MESVGIERSAMNPSRSFAGAFHGGNFYGGGGGFLLRSPSLSSSLLLGAAYGSLRPPPPPYYSPLPPPLSSLHYQPPLLPLPFSRSATLPPSPAAARARPGYKKKAKRPPTSAGPRKEARSNSPVKAVAAAELQVPDPKRAPRLVEEEEEEEGEEEIVMVGSVYSLAPPPSSLPLPSFSLMRPKASCTVEAAAVGGGMEGGATDDLRRLLRL